MSGVSVPPFMVGDVPNTAAPVPVSSDKAAASSAEVVSPPKGLIIFMVSPVVTVYLPSHPKVM